jgi:hypothetical protein
MNYKNIDTDKIILEDGIKTSLDIKTNSGNMFYTPVMYLPFGLEEYKNSYSLNLQFRNIDDNEELEDFLDFIQKLENKLKNVLDVDDSRFTSQLRFNRKYDPVLFTKLIFKFNKLECNVKTKDGEFLNIYDMGKNKKAVCLLLLDKVWLFKNKYSYKLKVKEIIIDN